jgi:2'-5' RNA ligase
MLRLFYALQPTQEQNAALVELVEPLLTRLNAQRMPAENLHATLCFIGAVAEERLDALKVAAATVRGNSATLRFDHIDFWPKPRVICATATEDAGLASARELSTRLASAAVESGFAPDLKPFRAHVTLARKVSAASAAGCEWPCVLAAPIEMQVNRFVLMRSDKGASGSSYSVVAEWPLYENVSR